jgi:hypothetical protein
MVLGMIATMPAYDLLHDAVKRGLIKDGWTITADPLTFEFGGLDLYIDLAAERVLAAEKGNERIAVEIKTFLGASVVTDFHAALGQFLNYQIVLDSKDPERVLIPCGSEGDLFRVLLFATSPYRGPTL